MESTGQKPHTNNYVWDINGEDYWILNDNVSEHESSLNDMFIKKK